MRWIVLFVLGIAGCAQHDLFHPGAISSGEAAGRLLRRSPIPALCKVGGGAQTARLDVNELGQVTHVESIAGPEAGRELFREAVQQWQYKPLLRNGEPVPFTTTVTVTVSCGG